MEFEVYTPEVDKSLEAESSILFWHKEIGEKVEEGEDLVEIETAKGAFILPAPVSGILSQILVGPGEEVHGGMKIAVITIE